jgi:S1-C subfamily serine protease
MNESSTEGALWSFSNDLATAAEKASRAVVAIDARPRVPSSGMIWRPGAVVAAAHTIKREEEISVTLPDGRSVPATLAGRDPSTDLAVLKVQNGEAPAAEFGDASTLRVGHLVLALGRSGPKNLSASLGVVSSLGGPWRTWRGGQIDQLIRLDVAIYLGFSGGGLVDASGRIVGLNTSGLVGGMAMAVPAATVHRVVDELLAKGRIARGYLGVGMQPVPLPETLRAKLNLSAPAGLIIVSVEPDGPADRAGIFLGDVLVALDGQPLNDIGDVQARLAPENIGKTLPVSVLRSGSLVELQLRVGERPRRA